MPDRTPHPVRDPLGHSYGEDAGVAALFAAAQWAESSAYLYAIDLWNAGYYWEVHEALESLWRGAADEPATAARLKGLIQSAAALLKHAMGELRGANRLAVRGAAALRAGPSGLLGFDAVALADRVEAFVAGERGDTPRIRLDGIAWVDGGDTAQGEPRAD